MGKLGRVIVHEFKKMLPVALFFLVTLHMLALTKAVVLEGQGISVVNTAAATIGALIVAKAVLVVELLPLAKLFGHRMLHNVLWKTLLFAATATLFQILEDLIPRLFHGQGLAEAMGSMIAEVHWPHFWVIQMWLVALLFLYCFMSDLFRAVGADRVRSLLRGPLMVDSRQAADSERKPVQPG
ncbi:hypothetical protein D3C84_374250 [compost metagenome]